MDLLTKYTISRTPGRWNRNGMKWRNQILQSDHECKGGYNNHVFWEINLMSFQVDLTPLVSVGGHPQPQKRWSAIKLDICLTFSPTLKTDPMKHSYTHSTADSSSPTPTPLIIIIAHFENYRGQLYELWLCMQRGILKNYRLFWDLRGSLTAITEVLKCLPLYLRSALTCICKHLIGVVGDPS